MSEYRFTITIWLDEAECEAVEECYAAQWPVSEIIEMLKEEYGDIVNADYNLEAMKP